MGDVLEKVVKKQTSHPFKRFRDYVKLPRYLKKGFYVGVEVKQTRPSSGKDGRIYPLAVLLK